MIFFTVFLLKQKLSHTNRKITSVYYEFKYKQISPIAICREHKNLILHNFFNWSVSDKLINYVFYNIYGHFRLLEKNIILSFCTFSQKTLALLSKLLKIYKFLHKKIG